MCSNWKTQILEWINVLQLRKGESVKTHPQKSSTLQYNYSHWRRSRVSSQDLAALNSTSPPPPNKANPHSRTQPIHPTKTRHKHSHPIAPKPPNGPNWHQHITNFPIRTNTQIQRKSKKGKKPSFLNALFHFSFISIWHSNTVLYLYLSLPDRQFVEFTYSNTLDPLSQIKANIQNRKFCTP